MFSQCLQPNIRNCLLWQEVCQDRRPNVQLQTSDTNKTTHSQRLPEIHQPLIPTRNGEKCSIQKTGQVYYHYEGYWQMQNTKLNYRPPHHSQWARWRRKTRHRIEENSRVENSTDRPCLLTPNPHHTIHTSTDTLTQPTQPHPPEENPPDW